MPATISIIAIHGLDGHLEQSWTADNGVLWLRDLLPELIPYARIVTYGYDGYTRGRDQMGDESIHDVAKRLLTCIAAERADTQVRFLIIIETLLIDSPRRNDGR